MNPPKPVSGYSRDAAWLNQLRAFCISLRLKSGRGYRKTQYPDGYCLDISTVGGVPAPAGTTIKQYLFSSHPNGSSPSTTGDYINCVGPAQNPKAPTVPTTSILKPYLLWFSIAKRTAYGIEIDYSAWDSTKQSRVATSGPYIITQYITPQYQPGDIIWATQVTLTPPGKNPGDPPGQPISTLIDINLDGRVFAGP